MDSGEYASSSVASSASHVPQAPRFETFGSSASDLPWDTRRKLKALGVGVGLTLGVGAVAGTTACLSGHCKKKRTAVDEAADMRYLHSLKHPAQSRFLAVLEASILYLTLT